MQSKHTAISSGLEAAFSTLLNEGGDDTEALVLNHLELSRRAIEWLMQRETSDVAGDRYSHDKPHDGRFSRWGSNPGSVAVGGQKLRVDVPRIRDNESQTTHSPEIYSHLRHIAEPPLHIMRALMLGLGTRKYRETAEMLLVVAIGITEHGVKRTLGLTQATTENSASIAVMFRSLHVES